VPPPRLGGLSHPVFPHEELTVSVSERPEQPDREGAPAGRGNAQTSGNARGKRGRPRRAAALSATDVDVSDDVGLNSVAVAGGGGGGGGTRDRGLRQLLAGLRALDAGEFNARLAFKGDALMLEIADVFNSVATKQGRLAEELNRVALSVGREGKMRDRATIGPAGGLWAGSVDALNSLITDLVQPTSEVARVIKAVAEGDLSQQVELEIDGKTVQGEFYRIGSTVNRMVDQLNAFASEVTRVAREVGTEGRLGGQANVQGVSGTWRDLTDSVNGMATNLTNQVRNIADVTTAVAKGDLSKKITAEAKGEILELKNTINTMVDQLSSFADEVTRVAREVGTEGVLGGQANVPGVAGTWKDLTD
jgi:HAMP domain-containing protein